MNGLGAAFSSVPEGDEELDRVVQADRRFFAGFPPRWRLEGVGPALKRDNRIIKVPNTKS